jgi:hypothetical protein
MPPPTPHILRMHLIPWPPPLLLSPQSLPSPYLVSHPHTLAAALRVSSNDRPSRHCRSLSLPLLEDKEDDGEDRGLAADGGGDADASFGAAAEACGGRGGGWDGWGEAEVGEGDEAGEIGVLAIWWGMIELLMTGLQTTELRTILALTTSPPTFRKRRSSRRRRLLRPRQVQPRPLLR